MAVRGGATPSRHVATHDRFATQNPKTLMECWVCTTYDTRHTTGATHADETGRHLRATREDAATTCKKKGKCYSPIFARTHQRLHHFFQFLNPLVALLLVGALSPSGSSSVQVRGVLSRISAPETGAARGCVSAIYGLLFTQIAERQYIHYRHIQY